MLSDRDLATVLAALRHWQQDLVANADQESSDPLSEYFADHPPTTREVLATNP